MAAAIIGVLFSHTMVDYGWLPINRLALMGQGGVDLFFLLSGYGLYYSYSRNPKPLQFYKRRFMRLLPTYWALTALHLLYTGTFSWRSLLYQGSTIGFWYDSKTFGIFCWFIAVILFFYAVFPIYYRLFTYSPRWVTLLAIAIALGLTFSFAYDHFAHGARGYLILFYARIPAFVAGIFLGYCSRRELTAQQAQRLSTWLIAISVVALIAWNVCVDMMGFDGARYTGLFYLPFVFMIPGGAIIAARLLKHSGKVVRAALTAIGAATLETYIALGDVYGLKTKVLATLTDSPVCAMLLLLLACIAVGLVLHAVMQAVLNLPATLARLHIVKRHK